MCNLLTIGGHGGMAEGKKGAFYHMLEEYHTYWSSIDIISTAPEAERPVTEYFGNVRFHYSARHPVLQPFFIAQKIKEICRFKNIDLIVVQEYPPFYNSSGLFFSGIRGIPVSYEIHHIVGYPRAGSFKEKFYFILNRLCLRYILKKADMVRVVNNEVKKLLTQWGIPENKIKIVSSFYINLDIFKPLASEKEFDLVFSARLVQNKGIFILLDAVSRLKNDNPNIRLLIIGDGPERGKVKKSILKLDIEKNVVLYGWVKDAEEVATLYNKGKIFVMPSFNEGGPRTMIEAMACGTPVLTTKIGMAKELVEDGVNGFFIDWNGRGIAERVKKLLHNPEQQRTFSERGIVLAQQFEKKKMINKYAQMYATFIEQWKHKHK